MSSFSKLIFVKTASTEGKPEWLIALFLLIGLGLLSLAGYNIYKNITTPWHIVTGYVETSEIVKHTSSEGTTFSPLIVYNYSYLGKWYMGSYRTGVSSGDYGEYQRIVSKYKPGTKIQVKVNPEDLQDSMIKQDFISENFEWLFVTSLGSFLVIITAIIKLSSKNVS